MKIAALAPIEVEILLLFSLKSKRLKRIAGLAPEKTIKKNQIFVEFLVWLLRSSQ